MLVLKGTIGSRCAEKQNKTAGRKEYLRLWLFLLYELMRTRQGIINLITVHKQHVSLSFINDVLESFVTKKYKLLHSTTCSKKKKNATCIWPTSCCIAQNVLSQYYYGLAFTTILFGDLTTRCKKSAYTILWGLCLIRIDNFVLDMPVQLKKWGLVDQHLLLGCTLDVCCSDSKSLFPAVQRRAKWCMSTCFMMQGQLQGM